jgi:hypothetical protein
MGRPQSVWRPAPFAQARARLSNISALRSRDRKGAISTTVCWSSRDGLSMFRARPVRLHNRRGRIDTSHACWNPKSCSIRCNIRRLRLYGSYMRDERISFPGMAYRFSFRIH